MEHPRPGPTCSEGEFWRRWFPVALSVASLPWLWLCGLLAERERWAVVASGVLLAAQQLSSAERYVVLLACGLCAAAALGPAHVAEQGGAWLAGGVAVASCLWAMGCLPFSPEEYTQDEVHRMLVETFRRFDLHGDGTISRQRLTRALQKLSLDDESINLAIDAAGSKGCEWVDYNKFALWISGFCEPDGAAPEGRYTQTSSLWAAVEAGEAMLLRGHWLVGRLKESSGLPTREELPPEAFWEAKELSSLGERMLQQLRQGGHAEFLPVVSVSLAQPSADGSGPSRDQLQTLAAALKHLCDYFAEAFQGIGCPADCGVFLGSCSLPRSQQLGTKHGLEQMSLWFGHGLVRKLLIGSPATTQEDGVAFLQSSLSGMISQYQLTLRLNGSESVRDCKDWGSLRRACTVGRGPPLTPEACFRLLHAKAFASDAVRDAAKHCYEAAFEDSVGNCRQLVFAHLGWGYKEARALAAVLPHCRSLTELFLEGNLLGDAGAGVLAEALPDCPRLREVLLARNGIGDCGAEQLAEALSKCSAVERLELHDNAVGEAGAASLAQALPALRCLRDLLLQGNCLGDAGVQALAAALPACGGLERLVLDGVGAGGGAAAQLCRAVPSCGCLHLLHLERNAIPEAAHRALREAWRRAAKPERSELNGKSYPALML